MWLGSRKFCLQKLTTEPSGGPCHAPSAGSSAGVDLLPPSHASGAGTSLPQPLPLSLPGFTTPCPSGSCDRPPSCVQSITEAQWGGWGPCGHCKSLCMICVPRGGRLLLKAWGGAWGAELLPWALGGDTRNEPPSVIMLAHTRTNLPACVHLDGGRSQERNQLEEAARLRNHPIFLFSSPMSAGGPGKIQMCSFISHLAGQWDFLAAIWPKSL